MKTKTVLSLFVATPALHSAVITYDFDGAVSGGMPHPSLPTSIYPGNTPFVGHFTFDSTTPQIGSTPTSASYALTELHLTFNPSTFPETIVITGGIIDVINGGLGDQFIINAGSGLPPTPSFNGGFNLDFHLISLIYGDPSGSVFSNTNLPGADLTEADFPPAGSYVFSYSDPGSFGTFNADGTLDNLSSASVPEPSGAVLMLSALAMGVMRRKR